MAVGSVISDSLFMLHAFIAGVSGSTTWAMDKSETDKVGDATARVARHYVDVEVAAETVDWINLAQVLAMTYGTRLMASSLERRSSRARTVSPIQPAPTTNGMEAEQPPAPPQDDKPKQSPGAGMIWAKPGPGLPWVAMPAQ